MSLSVGRKSAWAAAYAPALQRPLRSPAVDMDASLNIEARMAAVALACAALRRTGLPDTAT